MWKRSTELPGVVGAAFERQSGPPQTRTEERGWRKVNKRKSNQRPTAVLIITFPPSSESLAVAANEWASVWMGRAWVCTRGICERTRARKSHEELRTWSDGLCVCLLMKGSLSAAAFSSRTRGAPWTLTVFQVERGFVCACAVMSYIFFFQFVNNN